MILKRLRARLLAVAGLLAPATAVLATDGAPPPMPITFAPAFAPVVADCPGGCGTVGIVGPCVGGCTGLGAAGTGIGLFAPNRKNRRGIDGQQQPACAVNSFPLSDWLYIRRFCGPTILPGTCYGHFQTKWRKWEDHCPQQAGAAGCAPTGVPVFDSPPATYPSSQPLATPQLMPPAKTDDPKKADDPKKVDDPKKPVDPDEPKKPKTANSSSLFSPARPDLPLPGIPEPLPLRSTLK